MLPRFGTSTYFLLTALALVDFLSGVALRARRGVQAVTVAKPSRRSAPVPNEVVASEPKFDPTPEPSVPAATTVAESVLLDRPEPTIVHPAVDESGGSPEVRSPGLQPNDGAHSSPGTPPR